jgi:hypothetical protein
LTRTNPMTRDKNVETISTTVAENTECACDGRSRRSPRVHLDGAAPDALVGDTSVT